MANSDMCLKAAQKAFPHDEKMRVAYMLGFNEGYDRAKEQPEPTCKSCGFYENDCPFTRDKFIPYPNRVCKDYTYSVMKEQERPIGEEYAIEIGKETHTLRVGSRSDINRLIAQEKQEDTK